MSLWWEEIVLLFVTTRVNKQRAAYYVLWERSKTGLINDYELKIQSRKLVVIIIVNLSSIFAVWQIQSWLLNCNTQRRKYVSFCPDKYV